MNINPLFRKIMIGAAEASLDIAGSALLPGAWPIVKGALTPVLDKLKERLDGKDATSSPDLAEKAIEMFKKCLRRQSDYWPAYVGLALSYHFLGREKEAKEAVKEVLNLNPDHSITFVKKGNPYKNQAELERVVEALRKAGLPE